MQICSFGKYGICTRYIITLYSTSHSERPYFMLYQIMALSIQYPREWIHARRALSAHLSSVYAECGLKHQEKPRLLIISVQLSTARGLRAYFELSTAERRFLVFSYATTGQRLEEKKGLFQFLIDQRREEMRRDLATLHACNLCLWELGG
jgi:hypothetical protein